MSSNYNPFEPPIPQARAPIGRPSPQLYDFEGARSRQARGRQLQQQYGREEQRFQQQSQSIQMMSKLFSDRLRSLDTPWTDDLAKRMMVDPSGTYSIIKAMGGPAKLEETVKKQKEAEAIKGPLSERAGVGTPLGRAIAGAETSETATELFGLKHSEMLEQDRQLGRQHMQRMRERVREGEYIIRGDTGKTALVAGHNRIYDENGSIIPVPPNSRPVGEEGTPGERSPVQKKTAADLEKQLGEAQRGMSALQNLRSTYEDKYSRVFPRVGYSWDRWSEKLGGDLAPDEQRELGDFTEFKRASFEEINRYIRQMTGAQLSVKEAERLQTAMPDIGKGMLEGDSPTEYKRKLNGIMGSLRRAQARHFYALKNGYDKGIDVPPHVFNEAMNRAGDALEREGKARGLEGEELKAYVMGGLREEGWR